MKLLAYRAHVMLVSALVAVHESRKEHDSNFLPTAINALDLGCGTGLLADALEKTELQFQNLTCIDISQEMLKRARSKPTYTQFIEGDIASSLRSLQQQTYDLVVAADVLPYLARLDDIMERAHKALVPGGIFTFTVEALEAHLPLPYASSRSDDHVEIDAGDPLDQEIHTKGWAILSNGRVAHERAYVDRLARKFKFLVEAVGDGPIRWQRGNQVEGHVFVLKKV
ncbi:hypothetical protein GUITHDRAFT_161298 [Guillardia theta CCMP2712]|uniref:Methyltransferase type 11 domain-containing protein n=2 Tax=Guillardia theta TaxID=55529 RepID=L1JVG0_GUITC|nr:hypothetical protein GUITHDRAFT_161298 [Guillardia theta CCMP2712]EKX52088.1 hypothetical protein GUITHDRAFT_161298 [Guillardia theta CCMP2712]|eukprot:XP_005839068.1 hypothetical protein GUITHDRAFT_161298 [Guillardia theta CCMP2712]